LENSSRNILSSVMSCIFISIWIEFCFINDTCWYSSISVTSSVWIIFTAFCFF
jgi:hypothetical protein